MAAPQISSPAIQYLPLVRRIHSVPAIEIDEFEEDNVYPIKCVSPSEALVVGNTYYIGYDPCSLASRLLAFIPNVLSIWDIRNRVLTTPTPDEKLATLYFQQRFPAIMTSFVGLVLNTNLVFETAQILLHCPLKDRDQITQRYLCDHWHDVRDSYNDELVAKAMKNISYSIAVTQQPKKKMFNLQYGQHQLHDNTTTNTPTGRGKTKAKSSAKLTTATTPEVITKNSSNTDPVFKVPTHRAIRKKSTDIAPDNMDIANNDDDADDDADEKEDDEDGDVEDEEEEDEDDESIESVAAPEEDDDVSDEINSYNNDSQEDNDEEEAEEDENDDE
jgi:hypothetical protein